jgi:hypothetical protein
MVSTFGFFRRDRLVAGTLDWNVEYQSLADKAPREFAQPSVDIIALHVAELGGSKHQLCIETPVSVLRRLAKYVISTSS